MDANQPSTESFAFRESNLTPSMQLSVRVTPGTMGRTLPMQQSATVVQVTRHESGMQAYM